MRSLSLSVMVGLCALAPREAGAQESAKDMALELEGAITEGAYREALELGEAAVAAHPKDARLWKLRGVSLKDVVRVEEARAAFEQALRLAPRDVETMKALGWTLWVLDDPEAAYDLLLRAKKLAPRDPDVRFLLDSIDRDEMCRNDFWRSMEEGSPQYFAQRFMLNLKLGEHMRVLTDDLDPPLLDRWLPDDHRSSVTTMVEQLIADMETSLARRTLVPELVGFFVTDDVLTEGERAAVGVNVVVRLRARPELVATLREAGEDLTSFVWLRGKWGEMMRDLTPEQRELSLGAVAKGLTVMLPIRVELLPRGEQWKVVDVVVPAMNSMRLAELMDREATAIRGRAEIQAGAARAAAEREEAAAVAAKKASAARAAGGGAPGAGLWIALGVAAAGALLAFFVLRWRLGRSRVE